MEPACVTPPSVGCKACTTAAELLHDQQQKQERHHRAIADQRNGTEQHKEQPPQSQQCKFGDRLLHGLGGKTVQRDAVRADHHRARVEDGIRADHRVQRQQKTEQDQRKPMAAIDIIELLRKKSPQHVPALKPLIDLM
jgi:hypothetical protein